MVSPSESALKRGGILTLEQLAAELNVSVDTVLRWEKVDGFPGRRVGRTRLYSVEAIRAWVQAQ